jgi:hypothetical protein
MSPNLGHDGAKGDGLHDPSPRWEDERQKLVDRTSANQTNARGDIVARVGSGATSEQGDSADTDAIDGSAKTYEEILAELDLLAAMGEAEDIGRAELQRLSGDTAMPIFVIDGVGGGEWKRGAGRGARNE